MDGSSKVENCLKMDVCDNESSVLQSDQEVVVTPIASEGDMATTSSDNIVINVPQKSDNIVCNIELENNGATGAKNASSIMKSTIPDATKVPLCTQEDTIAVDGKKQIIKKRQFIGENMIRMNYLYQASRFLAEDDVEHSNESSVLGSLSSSVGRKGVIRVSSELKREFCKGCGSALIPSMTSRNRLRKNRQKHLVVTCRSCKTIKRFVTKPDYAPWSHQHQAIAD